MSPESAVEQMPQMLGEINRAVSFLRAETEDVAEQWEGLRRAGGQRADHAAMLLARLRPHLRDIASFCNRCESQLDGFVADPFQRKAG